jgi:hypothetical protein
MSRDFAATPGVDPSAGFFRVAAKIRERKAGVRTLGGWPG